MLICVRSNGENDGDVISQSAGAWLKALAITVTSYALWAGSAVLFVIRESDPPRAGCTYWCITPRAWAELAVRYLGVPSGAISLIVSLCVLLLAGPKMRSPYRLGVLASIMPLLGTQAFSFGAIVTLNHPPSPVPSPEPSITQCIPRSGGNACPGG